MKITIVWAYHKGNQHARIDGWGDGDLGYGDGSGGGEGQGAIYPYWEGGSSSQDSLRQLFYDSNGYMEFYA